MIDETEQEIQCCCPDGQGDCWWCVSIKPKLNPVMAEVDIREDW